DAVRQGALLCALSSREAALAIGEQAESRKDLDLAKKTYAMTKDLFDHDAASRVALHQAENDLAKAGARVDRNREALRVLGLSADADGAVTSRVPVRSPIGGTVIDRRTTEGQFVQTDGTPLVTVADLSVVWVLGDLFERDLRLVSIGQKVVVSAAADPAERFEARVTHISDPIDPATRTAKPRVTVPNPGGRLKPEMFATVDVGVVEAERVLTIPSRAAFVDEGRTWVFVASAPGPFVR